MKIWWCEEHGYQATEYAVNHPVEHLRQCWGTAYGESDGPRDSEEDYTPCRMVEREFLPEGALVIEKEDGEWPEWALQSLGDPPLYELSPRALALLEAGSHLSMPTKPRYILDALASQVGESE